MVKDDVREEFQNILKEVSEELEIPDGDVNKDEAMAAMSETLDQLMSKLSGAGENLERVQKTVNNIKKISKEELSLREDIKKTKDQIYRLNKEEFLVSQSLHPS